MMSLPCSSLPQESESFRRLPTISKKIHSVALTCTTYHFLDLLQSRQGYLFCNRIVSFDIFYAVELQ